MKADTNEPNPGRPISNKSIFSWLTGQIAVLGMVGLVLVWLPFEDQSILIPILLAIPVAGLIACLYQQRLRVGLIVCGLVGGLVVAPTTLLWMAFKTGVHGHGAADFTASQIICVIQGTPAWILAGGLLGWRWQKLRSRQAEQNPHFGE